MKIKIEVLGQTLLYCDDGPPNSGMPIIKIFDHFNNIGAII